MFTRILNSEMELATGCTEPGAVALTAAEAGCALRRAGANTVEEVLVSASVNIIKNAMSAGIPGTSYEGMDYAAAIGAVGGEPVHLLEVMNYVAPEQVEQAAALVKAGKVKVEVAQVPQKLYVDVTVKGEGGNVTAVSCSAEDIQSVVDVLQMNADDGAKTVANVKSDSVLILLHALDTRATVKKAAQKQHDIFSADGNSNESVGGNATTDSITEGADT